MGTERENKMKLILLEKKHEVDQKRRKLSVCVQGTLFEAVAIRKKIRDR